MVNKIDNLTHNKQQISIIDKGKSYWKYGKPSYKAVSKSLDVYYHNWGRDNPQLRKVISRVNLLAVVTLFFGVVYLPQKIRGCLNSLRDAKNDLETFFFQPLDLMEHFGDILLNVEIVLNFLQNSLNRPGLNILANISKPLALICSVYGSVKGIYNLRNRYYQWEYMVSEMKNRDDINKLAAFLDNECSSLRGRVKLIARTDERIVNIMLNLQTRLNDNCGDIQTVDKAVNDIDVLMKRKIAVELSDTISNVAITIVAVAALIFPVSAMTFSILLLAKSLLSLSQTVYMEHFYERGLYLPDFTKVEA